MDTSAKETVIIVHGTWAAPDPKRKQWYDRVDGDAVSRGFVAKLNNELEKRGSQARCWSHCTEGSLAKRQQYRRAGGPLALNRLATPASIR